MGFQYVASLPSSSSFAPHISKIVVEVKALDPPYVLEVWLVVSKSMLPVSYFCSIKSSFLCQSNFTKIIRLSQS